MKSVVWVVFGILMLSACGEHVAYYGDGSVYAPQTEETEPSFFRPVEGQSATPNAANDEPTLDDEQDNRTTEDDGVLSDAEVREVLIQEFIDGYPGQCPCPYSRARDGSRCGARSAYTRDEGYTPLCYAEDVTDAMIVHFRES